MFFPVFLALVPLFFVVQPLGLLGTYQGLILVYAAYAVPFTVFFLHAFFRTLPTEVAEAAFLDGARTAGCSSVSCCPWPGPVSSPSACSTSSGSGTSTCSPWFSTQTGSVCPGAGSGRPVGQSGLSQRLERSVRRSHHRNAAGAHRLRRVPTAHPRRYDRRRGQVGPSNSFPLKEDAPMSIVNVDLWRLAASRVLVGVGRRGRHRGHRRHRQRRREQLRLPLRRLQLQLVLRRTLTSAGWMPRTYAGGPGVPGATWSADSITFPTTAGRRSCSCRPSPTAPAAAPARPSSTPRRSASSRAPTPAGSASPTRPPPATTATT